MYSVDGFGQMINDGIRMDAFCRALRRAIGPGKIVLDVGTGTGIFALLSCRFGADHVYAVEPNDAICLAREFVDANGYGDRTTFIQGRSTDVTLPRKADVIVSDLRGVLPLFGRHIPSVVDARRRHLAPRGTLIPQRDVLCAALVGSPDAYEFCLKPWAENDYGMDMSAASRIVTNSWVKGDGITDASLIGKPIECVTLDYTSIESPNIDAQMSWTVDRRAPGHGFCVWFDTVLLDDIGFSNAPGKSKTVYGNAFFPWSQPVSLEPGDVVTVRLRANLVADDYVWQWNSHVSASGDASAPKANFNQSTFHGKALSLSTLRKKASTYMPRLNEDGRIQQAALELMDGTSTLEHIADELMARFPKHFPTWPAAMAKAGALSEKFG